MDKEEIKLRISASPRCKINLREFCEAYLLDDVEKIDKLKAQAKAMKNYHQIQNSKIDSASEEELLELVGKYKEPDVNEEFIRKYG